MILIGGRIVDPANNVDAIGDLRVDENAGVLGAVTSDGERLEAGPGERVVDCAGKVVCPGLIDIHVHLRVPGQEYKEDLESGAARGGGRWLFGHRLHAEHEPIH
jgi:dihydroorotase